MKACNKTKHEKQNHQIKIVCETKAKVLKQKQKHWNKIISFLETVKFFPVGSSPLAIHFYKMHQSAFSCKTYQRELYLA